MAGEEGGAFVSTNQIFDEVRSMKTLLETHVALTKQNQEGVEARLENHGTRLGAHDVDFTNANTRILAVENSVKVLQEADRHKQARRAPWWNIVGAVSAIIAGIGGGIALLMTLSSIADALNRVP